MGLALQRPLQVNQEAGVPPKLRLNSARARVRKRTHLLHTCTYSQAQKRQPRAKQCNQGNLKMHRARLSKTRQAVPIPWQARSQLAITEARAEVSSQPHSRKAAQLCTSKVSVNNSPVTGVSVLTGSRVHASCHAPQQEQSTKAQHLTMQGSQCNAPPRHVMPEANSAPKLRIGLWSFSVTPMRSRSTCTSKGSENAGATLAGVLFLRGSRVHASCHAMRLKRPGKAQNLKTLGSHCMFPLLLCCWLVGVKGTGGTNISFSRPLGSSPRSLSAEGSSGLQSQIRLSWGSASSQKTTKGTAREPK